MRTEFQITANLIAMRMAYLICVISMMGQVRISMVTVSLMSAQCLGDINDDGEVKIADLLVLISDWGICSDCSSDIDSDGQVNIADLLLLMANWGPCE